MVQQAAAVGALLTSVQREGVTPEPKGARMDVRSLGKRRAEASRGPNRSVQGCGVDAGAQAGLGEDSPEGRERQDHRLGLAAAALLQPGL